MRLVLVEWLDSFGCSSQWTELSDGGSPKVLVCRSAGWLFYDGDDCKVIIPHISADSHENAAPQGCGDMTIPTKAIVKITELRPTFSSCPGAGPKRTQRRS